MCVWLFRFYYIFLNSYSFSDSYSIKLQSDFQEWKYRLMIVFLQTSSDEESSKSQNGKTQNVSIIFRFIRVGTPRPLLIIIRIGYLHLNYVVLLPGILYGFNNRRTSHELLIWMKAARVCLSAWYCARSSWGNTVIGGNLFHIKCIWHTLL